VADGQKNYGVGRWRGLNTVDDPSVLEAGELTAMRNLVARSGALVRRPGLVRLSQETVARPWPPYVPPVDLPWVVQGDLWFRLTVPAAAVVGDEWTLRIEATSRAGAAAPGFAEGARVGLTVEGRNGSGQWVGFAYLELAAGGAVDVTTGWTQGVWSAAVRATEAGGCSALRLTVTFDGEQRDRDEVELQALDHIDVELPAEGVTPGVPFRVLCLARDADGLTLPFWSGRRTTLAWDDGAGNALTVTDEAGTGFDERGWTDGVGEWSAVLPARGAADSLRLQAMVAGAAAGTDTTGIVERFTMLWPTHAQAFQERTLEIRALTAAVEAREGFDGTGYGLKIEGYKAGTETWEEWAGLVTFPGGTAPEVTAGWSEGVWRQVMRFTAAGEYSQVRLTLLRGAVEAAQATGTLHPVTSAQVTLPTRVTAGAGFALVLGVLDEEGVRVAGFDGTGLSLEVTNEDGETIALVDAETGEAPALSTGWENGVWQGRVEFADAGDGEELRVAAVFAEATIGRGSAEIGEGAEGEVYGFQVWLPTGVAAGVPFELMLMAQDWWGGIVEDYAGEGLELVWSGLDAQTGEARALTVGLADGVSLAAGWEDGVWRGNVELASALGCETLRVHADLAGEERGSAEAPCAIAFALAAPSEVRAGNTLGLGIRATQADGAAAAAFAGEDLMLEVYRGTDGAWTAQTGPNVRVGWSAGWWAGSVAAGAAGSLRLVLLHEGEVEAEATVTVTAALEPPELPELPEEEDGETVRLTLSGPTRVWPGVLFELSARADVGGYGGEDAALTVSPGATPAPAIGSGWTNRVASSEWSWSGRVAGGHAGGTLRALLTWVPEYVPAEATPEDFEAVVEAAIGQLVPVVTLPAEVRAERSFALQTTMRADGAGGAVLGSYDGSLFEGYAVEVSTDGGRTYGAAPAGVLAAPGGGALATTGWSGGVLRAAAVPGSGVTAYTHVRVAATADGQTGPWAVAEVAGAAAGSMTASLEVPAELHCYGAAGSIRATFLEADGSAAVDPQTRVSLVLEVYRSGTWYAADCLLDEETMQPVGLGRGWTGNEWCVETLLERSGATAARVRLWQETRLLAEETIPLREDVAVAISAPATAVEDVDFAVTLTATDGDGGELPRFDDAAAGVELEVSATCTGSGSPALYDSATGVAPDWLGGWSGGVWSSQRLAVSAAGTCELVVEAARSGDPLDACSIEVEAVDAAVLAAIRQRQMAANRTVWAEGSSHTLEQYAAEANALGPSYAVGTYSGGASLPTMQSNTVADGAVDLWDIYAVLVAMRTTLRTVSVPNVEGYAGGGQDYDTDTAQAAARNSFAYLGGGRDMVGSYTKLWRTISVGTAANVYGQSWSYKTSGAGISTLLSKTVRVFAKHANAATYGNCQYDDFGYPGIPSQPDVYQCVQTVNLGLTGGTYETEYYGYQGGSSALPSWHTSPDLSDNGPMNYRGYGPKTGAFLLLDWGFSHT